MRPNEVLPTTPPADVPLPRSEAGANRLPPLEDLVAGIADLVLKATGLADRYEISLGRLTEPTQVAEQRARVVGLRSAAERGRDRLIEIGCRA